jgi:multicomponent Na+:H+ antiporter subunit D
VPALAIGVVICVLDIAAFGELCIVVRTSPWILEPRALWLATGALSAFVSALLMLAQRDLKRLLALSTMEDMGFLFFGLAASTSLGLEGAALGAATHAVAKALLFVSLASPEAGGELNSESHGLAARYPVSAAGFFFGMLAVLGIPPTIGFAGRWRIYEAALQLGRGWLVVLVASSMLALIAYVRALTGVWWGPAPENAPERASAETFTARVCVVVLAAILVVAGLLPSGLGVMSWGVR